MQNQRFAHQIGMILLGALLVTAIILFVFPLARSMNPGERERIVTWSALSRLHNALEMYRHAFEHYPEPESPSNTVTPHGVLAALERAGLAGGLRPHLSRRAGGLRFLQDGFGNPIRYRRREETQLPPRPEGGIVVYSPGPNWLDERCAPRSDDIHIPEE
jgi:hypothetical protein